MPATDSKQDSRKPNHFEPAVHCFPWQVDIAQALSVFSRLPHCVLLESSSHPTSPSGQSLGNFSFLAADPFAWHEVPVGAIDPFNQIRTLLEKYEGDRLAELPPFQGGWIGMLAYELNRSLERVPAPAFDEFECPAVAAGLYDTVIAWDHDANRTYIISQGFPETEPGARQRLADSRLSYFRSLLDSAVDDKPSPPSPPPHRIPLAELAPQYEVPGPSGLTSNFSREQYIAGVERAIEYIYAGDVFQINLTQRLLYPSSGDPVGLYQRMRKRNAAPFSAYFDMGTAHVVSASPERLVSVNDRWVETRPIKGTRKRTRFPQVDLAARSELTASEKDRAENVMIVDLMRNDLSRVCQDDSIEVTQLCGLETYESVLHLVSAIRGKLRDEHDVVDLLEAIFPGGSITGAPKVRAMEIISELEPTTRGAYCGSLGYIGFDGSADFNILIRTITDKAGWLQIPVGGGIVAQSNPIKEYEETWTKAAGMLRALAP